MTDATPASGGGGLRAELKDSVRCDACPVLCNIRPGKTGSCDRYTNVGGRLTRVDPLLIAQRAAHEGRPVVPFLARAEGWSGEWLPTAAPAAAPAGVVPAGSPGVRTAVPSGGAAVDPAAPSFVTGIGSGTTYPDYKPAPFIVASRHEGVDLVTVVTEGIFSYCGVKVKVDTDRHLGPEQAAVRAQGETIGHVTTAEYGSQMLALGGVRHLTGGSKQEGRVTCEALLALCLKQPVELEVEGGSRVVVQAGRPPAIDGVAEQRMRVGCGSATLGIFARQWHGHVDEVIVVDDQITGVLSEHQAGRFLDLPPAGIKVKGRRSTPGRYFQVAHPGSGWGGTDVTDPLSIVSGIDPQKAWPGLRLLMVSTTGEDAEFFVLDEALRPVAAPMPPAVRAVVERIGENCEPALCSVLFMAGAGGSLRAGVTENPVRLTRSVRDALTRVTSGGAPVYVWPGGGITYMVDVLRMPDHAFGSVPTPALVAPIEFTLRRGDYAALGGHMDSIVPLEQVLRGERVRATAWREGNPWPLTPPTPRDAP